MATKKQKRERLAAQRAERERQIKEDGLRAQREDQGRRALQKQMREREARTERMRMEGILALHNICKPVDQTEKGTSEQSA